MTALSPPGNVQTINKIGFYPGSTIGNLLPHAACSLLAEVRRRLGQGAWLIDGVDLRKSPPIMIPAYDVGRQRYRRLEPERAASFEPGGDGRFCGCCLCTSRALDRSREPDRNAH